MLQGWGGGGCASVLGGTDSVRLSISPSCFLALGWRSLLQGCPSCDPHVGTEVSPWRWRPSVPTPSPQDVPSLEEQMRALDVSTEQELTFEEFWKLMGELVRALWREKEGRKK